MKTLKIFGDSIYGVYWLAHHNGLAILSPKSISVEAVTSKPGEFVDFAWTKENQAGILEAIFLQGIKIEEYNV